MTATIQGAGGYLPLLVMARKTLRAELSWSGLGGGAKGARRVAGWDEDALTLATEAARLVVSPDAPVPSRVSFATTSAAFTDRSHAVILSEALGLPAEVDTLDLGLSRRSAVAALARALRSGAQGSELIAAGERRAAAPGNALQGAWGDGGAAVLVGEGPGLAKLLGAGRISMDLLDHFTSAESGLPYSAEERFSRDVAVSHCVIPAVKAALRDAGVEAASITLAVVAEPVSGTYAAAARKLGLTAPNLLDAVALEAGDLGTAAPLFGLALALEKAEPGARILLCGFGNGCDALILEVEANAGTNRTTQALLEGVALTSVSRFWSLSGALQLDWGPRAEVNQKISPSVLARHGRDMHGFIGGRDATGNVQFPKTPVAVNPDLEGRASYQDVPLRDLVAKMVSITSDRLNFTPDPPFNFGLVQFENGARVVMEVCDSEGAAPAVGDPLRMRFRIKSIDRQRKFRSYFWKAAPLARPILQGGK